MTFRAYIVEDSSTIRENLIETLEELAQVEPVGTTGSEHEARRWRARRGRKPACGCPRWRACAMVVA